jgi:hypothetical protein
MGSWIIGLSEGKLRHATLEALEGYSIISVASMERKEGEFLKN